MNFENAMRGARNPMNSWARSDSFYDEDGKFVFGPNDLDLAKRLAHAGSDHRKYLRMVFVSVDITAPLYWWKEYDTYKIATVANSTSTMHKITSKPFSLEDFSCDHMTPATLNFASPIWRPNPRRFGMISFSFSLPVITKCGLARLIMRP